MNEIVLKDSENEIMIVYPIFHFIYSRFHLDSQTLKLQVITGGLEHV